jgi:hypothetical protein
MENIEYAIALKSSNPPVQTHLLQGYIPKAMQTIVINHTSICLANSATFIFGMQNSTFGIHSIPTSS